jgi:hypothetical protein
MATPERPVTLHDDPAPTPGELPWLPNFAGWLRLTRDRVPAELLVTIALELLRRGYQEGYDVLDVGLRLRHLVLTRAAERVGETPGA